MQYKQETLVHIIPVLNITRNATQVNRQHINLVMDAVERTHQDVTTLYNITSSLYTSLNYNKLYFTSTPFWQTLEIPYIT